MALADIQEKQNEERKREKRLVHFTNAETRTFLESPKCKSRTQPQKRLAEYLTKSFLDYLFFEQHKEIREVTVEHVQHFLIDFAPNKLTFTTTTAKKVPEILSDLFVFLDAHGHIKNSSILVDAVKEHATRFQKLVSGTKKHAGKKREDQESGKSTAPEVHEQTVGRNDPCPCGSGKKYKKCCGSSS